MLVPPYSGGAAIEYLSIALKTKSGTDLSKSGVYRYVVDDDFEILLFDYSINGGRLWNRPRHAPDK